MTDHNLEQRLRAWYRADIDERESAPYQLRADLATLAQTAAGSRRPWTTGWRFPPMNRSVPIALAATAVVVAILIGIGLLGRSPDVGPTPVPGPTHSATPEPTGPLGGGSILAHEVRDESHPGSLNLFTVDAGSGQQTLVGTVQARYSANRVRGYNLQWGADRRHVLITDAVSGTPVRLENPTSAARDLIFVYGEPEVYGAAQLSPQSDRVASLLEGDTAIPGCLLCADAPAAVVILDVNGDGGNLRTIPLPDGTLGHGSVSWSPNGSAVVVSGCRPCNNAGLVASTSGGIGDSGGDWSKLTPTAVEHAHLYIVPIDGSAVLELVDETETMLGAPGWSADGTTIAFIRHECPADEHAPYCLGGTVQIVTMSIADGLQTVLADVTVDDSGPVWSPDGRQIAFAADGAVLVMDADGSHLSKLGDGQEPRWSPDGQWLLFTTYDQALDSFKGPWIVAADGGEPQLLGSYGGWAW